MVKRDRMSGNEAVATAMRQINPDVMGAFPITPSTEIPQYYSRFIADGLVDTEFVPVESEHSAMSVCIGASAAGARAVTATSSAGLAFMWELLYVAASARLPITVRSPDRSISIMTTLTPWEQETQAGSRSMQKPIRKFMIITYRQCRFRRPSVCRS